MEAKCEEIVDLLHAEMLKFVFNESKKDEIYNESD